MKDAKTNNKFIAKGLAPREVPNRTKVWLRALIIPKDGQQGIKLKLYEISRDVLSLAYRINGTNPSALTEVLGATIEGKDIYKYSIGEFFELYGKFMQKIGLQDDERQTIVKEKMKNLIAEGDEDNALRTYRRGNHTEENYPLPLYVRNALAHKENELNLIENSDLPAAIELLRKWLDRVQ